MTEFSAREPSADLLDDGAPRMAPAGAVRPAPTSGATKAGGSERNGGIDALRAAVTLLVVFHHTALTYGTIGSWYYREIAPSESAILVGVALAWRGVEAPALVKFLLTGSVACALCYIVAGRVLRIPGASRIV
jgi:hypothetical protein